MKTALKKITPLYQLYLWQFSVRNQIRNWWTIPGYAFKRRTIVNFAKQFKAKDIFLETGTYMGDTVDYVKAEFKQVFSIELNPDLAKKAADRFRTEPNVKIVQGDSAKLMESILADLSHPIVFWLDGHYSSEFQAGDEYIVTAKGEKDTPIMEELKQISRHAVKTHLVLIDDARLFNGTNDYPTKQQLRSFVKQHFRQHRFSIKNDIIRILPLK